MHFEFATSSKIIFGVGSLGELNQEAMKYGHKIFLLLGGESVIKDIVLDTLKQSSFEIAGCFRVIGEPSVEMVNEGIDQARKSQCDMVVGCGGGSVMDTAKAVAALLANPGDLLDYLEVVGLNHPLESQSVPMIAIPTTAGTGSEVTRNSVLSVPQARFKVSLRSPYLLPRLALIDPRLALSLPPQMTAATGLDALTQVLEPFVSIKANPMTDIFCREGLERIGKSILRTYHQGNDIDAREDMAWGSLLGGLSLANAGLGAVHGFAAPIGGMFNAPHGAVCARLLPGVMAMNIRALNAQQSGSMSLQKYLEAAQIITGRTKAKREDGVKFVESLIFEMKIPSLSHYGITVKDLPVILEKASQASSMKGNPVKLTIEECLEILEGAL